MMKLNLLFGLTMSLASLGASGAEFPFAFKSLGLEEAFSFAGGYGVTAQLHLARPEGVVKEPKAISAHPLYGQYTSPPTTNGILFRLDESKGTGKGYDTLILDLNENGDLTDDAATALSKAGAKPQPAGLSGENGRFGPIAVPDNKRIGDWRPVYYAEYYLYNRNFAREERFNYLGYLRFKAGWYLETTADFGGEKHKLALYDANSNLRLGERPTPQFYNNRTNWYFVGGDSILVDGNNSGQYEVSTTNNESCQFSSVLYHGPKPYQFSLADDRRSVRIEPYTGVLAEAAVRPRGGEVRTVTLAWEETPDQWQVIKAGVATAKAQLPPGKYRLTGCELYTTGASGIPVVATGYKRTLEPTMQFQPGGANVLLCGAPLEVKVTAAERQSATVAAGASLKERVTSALRREDPEKTVNINALVMGQGGETYSAYAMGLEGKSPPKPKYAILAWGGKEIASGNLEFG
jgi:hypothetical protein